MMIEKIGKAAMLEQMAEEASELAQAALKLARIIRQENPTHVTKEAAEENLLEEYTDVITCARELSLKPDEKLAQRKNRRFLHRWINFKNAK